jgi:hypothetical protein
VPPLEEDEKEEEQVMEASVLPVEQYQPPNLSEEEALRRAIEESELAELENWEGLGAQLAASVFTSRGGASNSGADPSSIHVGASSSHQAPPPPIATRLHRLRRQLPSPNLGATPPRAPPI